MSSLLFRATGALCALLVFLGPVLAKPPTRDPAPVPIVIVDANGAVVGRWIPPFAVLDVNGRTGSVIFSAQPDTLLVLGEGGLFFATSDCSGQGLIQVTGGGTFPGARHSSLVNIGGGRYVIYVGAAATPASETIASELILGSCRSVSGSAVVVPAESLSDFNFIGPFTVK
jgi:hypothetical protein